MVPSLHHISCWFLLSLGVSIPIASAGSDVISESYDLEISMEYSLPGNGTVEKTIKCGYTAHSANIASVTELSLLTSVPCDALNVFHTLASVDVWSDEPTLVMSTEESAVVVSGSINSSGQLDSHLAVSWTSDTGHFSCSYKCLVRGLDKNGRALTITRTMGGAGERNENTALVYMTNDIEVEVHSMSEALQNISDIVGHIESNVDNGACCQKLDSLEGKVDGLDVHVVAGMVTIESKIDDIGDRVKQICPKLHNDTETTATELVSITDKLKPLDRNVNNIDMAVRGMNDVLRNISNTVHEININVENGNCSEKIDSIGQKIDTLDMKVGSNLSAIEDKVDNVSKNVEQINTKLQNDKTCSDLASVKNKLDAVENNVAQLTSSIATEGKDPGINGIEKKLDEVRSMIIWYNGLMHSFDFSTVRNGKIYMASKVRARFNIDNANTVCRNAAGYLVELDSDSEFFFVRNFAIQVGGGGGYSLFTGTNDISREKKFVHKNSGSRLSINKWARKQPDNGRGNEDCVEFNLRMNGYLNDDQCYNKGKYICEVPFPP